MTIQFIVEDGTAKTDATSYITIAEFKQYWENVGLIFTDTDAVIQGYLNAATAYIDMSFSFLGMPATVTQALHFPRSGMRTRQGSFIDTYSIPAELKKAVAYMGYKVKQNGGAIDYVYSGVSSESFGPVSKNYTGNTGGEYYATVNNLLNHFIKTDSILVRVN